MRRFFNPDRAPGSRRIKLALGIMLLMGLLLCAALECRAQPATFSQGWLASGDPCLPTKREKRWLESQKYSSAYLSCVPVKFTVTWDLTDTFHQPPPLGVDRAALVLEEKFDGFLRIVRRHKKPRRVRHFMLMGPAPQGPGKIQSELVRAQATVTGCTKGGGNCSKFSTDGTTIGFEIKPVMDGGISFGWANDGLGNTGGGAKSSTVRLVDGVVPDPYSKRGGIMTTFQGATYRLDVKAADSLTWAEIKRGMERGELTKTFPLYKRTDFPAVRESRIYKGNVRVKIEFGEQEDERWEVSVYVEDQSAKGPPIRVRPPGKPYIKLPVGALFNWELTGEFIIKRSKQRWWYKSGKVTAATVDRVIDLDRDDLCTCSFTPCKNPPADSSSLLRGAYLGGKRAGAGLKLLWPSFKSEACGECWSIRVADPSKPYRHRFISKAMMPALSRLVLPLKDGYSKKGKLGKRMTYTITLRKLD